MKALNSFLALSSFKLQFQLQCRMELSCGGCICKINKSQEDVKGKSENFYMLHFFVIRQLLSAVIGEMSPASCSAPFASGAHPFF